MFSSISDWPTADIIFLICAVLGGVAFSIWLLMQFFGVDHGMDADVDLDTDFDAHEASGGADISFTLLSFQGLSAFLTIFGLVGLSVHREANLGTVVAVLIAAAAGMLMSWFVGKLFASFVKLQSSGTIKMTSAVGQEGSVYLTIPENGEGKVQLTVQGRFRVLPAISEGSVRIETGARVKVVRVDDAEMLIVKKV
ncbi:MAG: hypothetical protein R3A47_05770 [Polyangiales bacterium]